MIFRRAAWFLVAACALCAAPARAQLIDPPKTLENTETLKYGHLIPKKEAVPTPIPFTKRDFIRFTVDPAKKPQTPGGPVTVNFGEPVILNFRLVNHTEFPIVMMTSVHPRASLKAFIQPEADRERRTYGPYPDGQYPPGEVYLYPFEERVTPFVLWGDLQTPNGLVFPAPGRYRVRFELQVGARATSVSGSIPPVDSSLKPLAPIVIDVLPSPPSEEELVKTLAAARAFPDLQLKRIPAALEGKLEGLVEKHPTTAITPYLDYSIAMRAWTLAGIELKDDELFNKALRHVQRTALADSAIKVEAWLTLVRLYDYRGLGDLAASAAEQLIASEAPADVRPLLGSVDYIRRLLVNSTEIDPAAYWEILEP